MDTKDVFRRLQKTHKGFNWSGGTVIGKRRRKIRSHKHKRWADHCGCCVYNPPNAQRCKVSRRKTKNKLKERDRKVLRDLEQNDWRD